MWQDENFRLYLETVLASFVIFQWICRFGATALFTRFIPKEYEAMNKRQKTTSCIAIASSVHGTIMFSCCAYLLVNYDLHLNKCWWDSLAARLLTCMEIGFYFSENLELLREKSDDEEVIYEVLHHFSVVVASSMTVLSNAFAYFVCLRGLSDLSVPFQHMRILLSNMRWTKERIYVVNGVLFMITFFFARMCVMPITYTSIFAEMYTEEWARINTTCKVIFLGFAIIVDVLNIIWFYCVSRGVYKLLTRKPKEA